MNENVIGNLVVKERVIDNFVFHLLNFLSSLHDCRVCNKVLNQINGKGKRRTFCGKYRLPVQRVRWHCIDRFMGFNSDEIKAITKQYKAGKCSLVINEKEV